MLNMLTAFAFVLLFSSVKGGGKKACSFSSEVAKTFMSFSAIL